MVERRTENPCVGSSILPLGTAVSLFILRRLGMRKIYARQIFLAGSLLEKSVSFLGGKVQTQKILAQLLSTAWEEKFKGWNIVKEPDREQYKFWEECFWESLKKNQIVVYNIYFYLHFGRLPLNKLLPSMEVGLKLGSFPLRARFLSDFREKNLFTIYSLNFVEETEFVKLKNKR